MEAITTASAYLFSVQGIFLIVIGTALGITMGAIPGLTGAMLIALTVNVWDGSDKRIHPSD